ncbi:MAG: hypothetical protein IK151_08430 [Erysipelotrichaceae bacterium]|nr:hypothetical protein [Erysipelotrichaceae bacterium]
MYSFGCENKKIEIEINDPHDHRSLPVILINCDYEESKLISERLSELNCPDHILVIISGMNWNDDLTPWRADPIFKKSDPFSGKADEYLKFITDRLLPEINSYLNSIGKEIEYYALGGYSLAGLFALYAAYKCDTFRRIASSSGSLWYPGIKDFVLNNEISSNVDKICFSLGDKESQTRNEMMSKVENNTIEICNHLKNKIKAAYFVNEGNHFKDPDLRTAKDIKYILED